MNKLRRRSFIKGGMALPIALSSRAALAQFSEPETRFIVFHKIPPSLTPEKLQNVLRPFLDLHLPICVFHDGPDALSHSVHRYLIDLAMSEPGAVELVPVLSVDPGSSRYFQLRRATDIQRYFARDMFSNTATAPAIVSYHDTSEEDAINRYAMRAAGFRIRFRPDMTQAPHAKPPDWGQLDINGGTFWDASVPPPADDASISETGEDHALYLSLAGVEALSSGAAGQVSALWAEHLFAAYANGRIFPSLPKDYLINGHPGVSKNLVLLFDKEGREELSPELTEMTDMMRQANLPYSVLNGERQSGITCTDVPASSPVDGTFCAMPDEQGQVPNSASVVLHHRSPEHVRSGPADDARYHIVLEQSYFRDFEELTEGQPLSDVVHVMRAGQVHTPFLRRRFLDDLQRVHYDGKVHLRTMRGFIDELLAPTAAHLRIWSARNRQHTDPPDPNALQGIELESLINDAKLAWRFIEKYTHDTTGICTGTVQSGLESILNNNVTLWDIASQMFGILAARDMGLIASDEAASKVSLILESLPTVELDGHPLPPALFNAATLRPVGDKYDVCDTGRFLVALKALTEGGIVNEKHAQQVLSKWELQSSIQSGRMFSFGQGVWQDKTDSHCTHYVRNGFSHWGIRVDSAYYPLTDSATGDDQLRFLDRIAEIGHIATEPHLLEALELGHSQESRYIADVLFDAQVSSFERTGRYKCVSELPLNFEPWFAYQGLRVDRSEEEEWAITAVSGSEEYQSPDFLVNADIISSKAAYLWAAAYPHEYTAAVLNLIQSRARIPDEGFSVGIFSNTLEPLENYSDVNTNGIILMAISRLIGV